MQHTHEQREGKRKPLETQEWISGQMLGSGEAARAMQEVLVVCQDRMENVKLMCVSILSVTAE